MKKNLFVFTILLMLIGCEQKKIETKNEILKVKAGKDFTIELESNPSTGYRWTICNYTPAGLIKLNDYKFEMTKDKQKIGTPGKEKFKFEVEDIQHQATVYLSFNYVGPGQDGSKPTKTVNYVINIT